MVLNDRPTCKDRRAAELILARSTRLHQRPNTLPQTCLLVQTKPCSHAADHTLSVLISSAERGAARLLNDQWLIARRGFGRTLSASLYISKVLAEAVNSQSCENPHKDKEKSQTGAPQCRIFFQFTVLEEEKEARTNR
jgi:hypothetical protein